MLDDGFHLVAAARPIHGSVLVDVAKKGLDTACAPGEPSGRSSLSSVISSLVLIDAPKCHSLARTAPNDVFTFFSCLNERVLASCALRFLLLVSAMALKVSKTLNRWAYDNGVMQYFSCRCKPEDSAFAGSLDWMVPAEFVSSAQVNLGR